MEERVGLESGISLDEEKRKKETSRLKLIINFTGRFIEIGSMTFMIFMTFFLILFEEEKLPVFFVISVIGIGIFISQSWKTFFVFHFINLWYFWLLISFAYYILDYELSINVFLDILFDIILFSFLFYKSYKSYYEYPLFYCGIVLLVNLLPFDSHSSFHSILESSIRCLLFFFIFIMESFYKTICLHKEEIHEGCIIILKNNYIFFANIWTLILFFPLHVVLISFKLYQKWPSKNLKRRVLEGETEQEDEEEEYEEEQEQEQEEEEERDEGGEEMKDMVQDSPKSKSRYYL